MSGDWFDEVREVDFADLKQEPDDVCCVLCPISVYYKTKNLYRSLVTGEVFVIFVIAISTLSILIIL